MAPLMKVERPAFYAPTARRHYFTRKAAANAEARAQIIAKYPTERPDHSVGDGGWHWSNDERLGRAQIRLARRIHRASLSTPEATK